VTRPQALQAERAVADHVLCLPLLQDIRAPAEFCTEDFVVVFPK
jgi:hypothetical protein